MQPLNASSSTFIGVRCVWLWFVSASKCFSVKISFFERILDKWFSKLTEPLFLSTGN